MQGMMGRISRDRKFYQKPEVAILSHEPPVPYVHVKRSGGRRKEIVDREINMASPRTRRVLKEIKPKDGNTVSKILVDSQICYLSSCFYKSCDVFCVFDRTELFRMRCS